MGDPAELSADDIKEALGDAQAFYDAVVNDEDPIRALDLRVTAKNTTRLLALGLRAPKDAMLLGCILRICQVALRTAARGADSSEKLAARAAWSQACDVAHLDLFAEWWKEWVK